VCGANILGRVCRILWQQQIEEEEEEE